MIRLEVLEGIDVGRVVESTDGQLVIGRAPELGFQLSDVHLSAEHGVVFCEDGRYIYRDLHSTNGSMILRGETRTVLDGANRWEATLADGDHLLLGDANTPVVLGCTLRSEQRPNRPSERIIATRGLNELKAVTTRLEEQGHEVSALYRALKMVGGRLELDEALDAVAGAVFELAPKATHLSILLRDGQTSDRFVPMLARSRTGAEQPDSVMMSRAVLKRVLDDQAAVLAANAMDELSASESIMGANIHSTVGVPLRCGDQIIGVIEADNRAGSGMFTSTDLERLMVLAEQAALAVENAQLYQQLKVAQEKAREENLYLKGRQKQARFENIIGDSAAMKAVFKQLERVIDTRATVCIGGETGTGKELIASAIHYQGKRSDKMFVAQNCAALPENLLESELFGHKRGSFTGADQDKKGLFEIADGGTLFLDEVGEMPLALQAKLLRVLQEGEIRPVGAPRAKRVDVRIICATNRNLEEEVQAGRFRQDLFYRLMVFPLVLPTLRERVDDIPQLTQHFLKRYTAEMHKAVGGISQQALNHLKSYHWPGNIRELENEVQRLVIQSDEGEIVQPEHLSAHVRRVEGMVARVAPRKGTLKEMMESVERWMLTEALKEHGNNKTKTAVTLGITREGLHKKLAKHGI